MNVVDLTALDRAQLDQLAALTFEAGSQHSPSWLPTLDAARETIDEARDKFARVLLDDHAIPLAWIAAGHDWGRIWEIHPMIVGLAHQRRGYGRLLVREVAAQARAAGALTLMLSTSDLTRATSLSGSICSTSRSADSPSSRWTIIPSCSGRGSASGSLESRPMRKGRASRASRSRSVSSSACACAP